jgi:hypothetical protein
MKNISVKYESSSTPIHLTRRGKLGRTVLAASLIGAGGFMAHDMYTSVQDRPLATFENLDVHGAHREVTVMPGDTLSDIAQEAFPDAADYRDNVQRMTHSMQRVDPEKKRPSLSDIMPGDVIMLPLDAVVGDVVDPSQDK